MGTVFALLGLLGRLRLEALVPFPLTLELGGIFQVSLGIWILFHPSDIVVDRRRATIQLRSPVQDQLVMLSDVATIQIQPQKASVSAILAFVETGYDVVLVARARAELAIHRDLSLAVASLEADRLAGLIGKPVIRLTAG